jgi:hypothetical protein
MEIEGKLTTYHQTIAEKFNTYYVSVADNITKNNQAKNTIKKKKKKDPLNYLYSAFQQSFTNIKLTNTNTGEIEKIITQLKRKKLIWIRRSDDRNFKNCQSIYCVTLNTYM